jgi:hypothetical protein
LSRLLETEAIQECPILRKHVVWASTLLERTRGLPLGRDELVAEGAAIGGKGQHKRN